MSMYASRLKNPAKDTICEECGKEPAVFGVVSMNDLENTHYAEENTRREKVEYLIWEQGIGEILCTNCLKRRIKNVRD